EIDHHKEHIGKIHGFFTFVHHEIFSQVTVQVHRSQTHTVQFPVGFLDGSHHGNIAHIRNHCQTPHCCFDSFFDALVIHDGGNIQGSQVAGNTITDRILLTIDVDV